MRNLTCAALFLAAAGVLAGCEGRMTEQVDATQYADQINADSMKYAKDERAGLCFAYFIDQSNSTNLSYRETVTMGNVSCTDPVLAKIAQRPAAETSVFDPSKLMYRQDKNTSECFAFAAHQSLSTDLTARVIGSITGVPCTEKVMGLIASTTPAANKGP